VAKLAKPNALMFFHIPLYDPSQLLPKTWLNLLSRPESYSKADIDSQTKKLLDVGLHDLESAGNAKGSDGFFEKGILKALESDHITNTIQEVKVIGNGHCHGTSSFF